MYKRFFKRIIDLLVSTIAFVILSPVILIAALLVKINLGSPVLFSQIRIGKNEKKFRMYKFRSMNSKCDSNGKLLPDIERLTKFGQLLRSTSIDELPALFNIIKGDMSIVGPRPLPVSYLPYYTETEQKRHTVRGGLTGLAQINGRAELDWDKRFEYDIQYIENISFKNDMIIILKTFGKVFKREHISIRGVTSPQDLSAIRPVYRNIAASSPDNKTKK